MSSVFHNIPARIVGMNGARFPAWQAKRPQ